MTELTGASPGPPQDRHRTPRYRAFRDLDRLLNRYPLLSYPEIYVLEGGYRNFYEAHEVRLHVRPGWAGRRPKSQTHSRAERAAAGPPLRLPASQHLCEPRNYVPMNHLDFLELGHLHMQQLKRHGRNRSA